MNAPPLQPLPRIRLHEMSALDILAIINEIGAAKSLHALHGTLKTTLGLFGFTQFSVVRARVLADTHFHEVMLQSWPPHYRRDFYKSGLYCHDVVVKRSLTESEPFFWSLADYDPVGVKEHGQLLKFRQGLGVTGGLCVPAADVAFGRWILYAAGAEFDRDPALASAMQALSRHVVGQVIALRSDERRSTDPRTTPFISPPIESLTPRERQIMAWTAVGRSSAEIAELLQISIHTVNDHANGAMRKLKARNRAEAAVRAVLLDETPMPDAWKDSEEIRVPPPEQGTAKRRARP